MSESKAIELLGEIISGQILQDRNDTFYCEWCNADAPLIDEIVHGAGCVVGQAQTYLAAHDAAPDVQAQKAALADEVASVVRQGGTITVGQVLEAEDWLARYDAIAQQQEADSNI